LFPTEFLDSLHLSDLPPHSLVLKKGTIVILLRNLNVIYNLMNGTRLIVRNMYDHSLDLESITGKGTGQRILLPRIDLTPSDSTLLYLFTRHQFPIRIAFAILYCLLDCIYPILYLVMVNFMLPCPELDFLKS
jgi:hypothetical protein